VKLHLLQARTSKDWLAGVEWARYEQCPRLRGSIECFVMAGLLLLARPFVRSTLVLQKLKPSIATGYEYEARDPATSSIGLAQYSYHPSKIPGSNSIS